MTQQEMMQVVADAAGASLAHTQLVLRNSGGRVAPDVKRRVWEAYAELRGSLPELRVVVNEEAKQYGVAP